jgi:Spy/CpxP family protein refolding chaperone
MTNKLFLAIAILISCSVVLTTSAQQPKPPQGPDQQMQPRMPQPPDDPLADAMFPPELIMQNQRRLALTDDQKTYIQSEMSQAAARFSQLQWQLDDAMEALHETMKANQVNEQQALAQLSKVLDAEREIKTLHMGMAIRIKNKLTPDQQMKLQSMRSTMMGQPGGQRRGQPGGPPDGPGRGPRPGPGGPGPGGPGPGGPGGGGPRPGGRPGGPPNF